MADATALQELISRWEDGEYPDGTDTAAFLNTMMKGLNGTFTEADIDGDGIITISYGNCSINGTPTAINIDQPLFAAVIDGNTGECFPAIQITKVETVSCRIILGTKLAAGTHKYEITYRQ